MEKVSCLLSYFVEPLSTKVERGSIKQIAGAFENHIDSKSDFHNELLVRMATEIPKIRPAVLTHSTYLFLDKFREFCDHVAHAYDCELDENELEILQEKIKKEFAQLGVDLGKFRSYVQSLANHSENQF